MAQGRLGPGAGGTPGGNPGSPQSVRTLMAAGQSARAVIPPSIFEFLAAGGLMLLAFGVPALRPFAIILVLIIVLGILLRYQTPIFTSFKNL